MASKIILVLCLSLTVIKMDFAAKTQSAETKRNEYIASNLHYEEKVNLLQTTFSTKDNTAEPCTYAGVRCSSDCSRIEVCGQNGEELEMSAVIHCHGAKPFCDVGKLRCADHCNTGNGITTNAVVTTYLPAQCTEAGPRCSEDCSKIEVCTQQNDQLHLSTTIQCHGPRPYCNIDELACSQECRRGQSSATTGSISTEIVKSESCQGFGYRCSADCRHLEFCTRNGLISVLQTCSGNTPFCNVDELACSQECRRGQSSTTTGSTSTEVVTSEPCQGFGYRCSADCRHLEFCTRNGLISVLQTCSGNTPFCNINYMGCYTQCTNTSDVTSTTSSTHTTYSTVPITSTTYTTSPVTSTSHGTTPVTTPNTLPSTTTSYSTEPVTSTTYTTSPVTSTSPDTTPVTTTSNTLPSTTTTYSTEPVTSTTYTTSPVTPTRHTTVTVPPTPTVPSDPCYKPGYRCSSNCERVEFCNRNGSTLVLIILEYCSGNRPHCNIDALGCSTQCKL